MTTIGEQLKKIRVVGIRETQKLMAERLNVEANYYSRIERGVASPTLKKLQNFADILQCNFLIERDPEFWNKK